MTRPRHTPLGLLAVLVAATAANIGYSYSRSRPQVLASVATLAVPSALPPFTIRRLSGDGTGAPATDLPAGCRILVVFNPACPHCHTAAAREATSTEADRLPTIWLSSADDAKTAAFVASVRPGNPVLYSADAPAALRARAVPAAFLVSAGDTVRAVWPYHGKEPHGELRNMCGS